MRWPADRLLAAALSLAATYAFFAEYLPPIQRVHLFSDAEVYHYPLQRYAFDALKHGRLPQWDPSMYCGIAFAGNIQAALFYPPNWLMYAANWRHPYLPFRSLEYFAFAHVWLAFVLCYLWLRARRLDWFASALGAMGFAFGGYLLWAIVHLGVTAGMPWLPLALWGIDEAAERRDWRPLWKTALASAMWFLAGYPPSFAAFTILAVLYALAGSGRWRAAAGTALAMAASLLLAMVQLLPTLEVQGSMFTEPRYTGETRSAFLPLLVANWVNGNRSSPVHYLKCIYLYWGVAAIFALLWVLWRRNLRPLLQPLAVVAAGLFLVVDPHALVYWTIVWIPLLESGLQSFNFYEGVAAMGALITAIGIAGFLKRGSARTAPLWLMPVVVLSMAAWSARQMRIWAAGGAFPSGGRALAETAATLVLFAVAMGTLRAEKGARRASLAAAVILFALCDFKVYGTNRLFNTRDGDVDAIVDVGGIRGINDVAYRALQANRQYRVTSDGSPTAMDFRMWGLATPQGLDPFLTRRYRRFVQPWATFQTSRVFLVDYRNDSMLQTLGVRYAITYKGAASAAVLAASPRFRRLGPDSFYQVYEYRDARPPFGFDGTAGEAHPSGWTPERRSFQVRSPAGGRFTLVEQFLPGWTATVDGRPVPVELWRGVFQLIAVPPGEHTVVFRFRSPLLPVGAAISLLAWAGLIAVAALKRRGTVPALPRHRIPA